MCNNSCLAFVDRALPPQVIEGRDVLELGAMNVNGTVRDVIEPRRPKSYVGIDIEQGPGVDVVLPVERLLDRFPPASVDVAVSTEMVEHVRDWRAAFTNIKQVVRPGGRVVITTRSIGFEYHGYPHDYWRFEPSDMEAVFADFDDVIVEPDPEAAGVFVTATKPATWTALDLGDVALYSIVTGRRQRDLTDRDWLAMRARKSVGRWLPPTLREAIGGRLRRRRA